MLETSEEAMNKKRKLDQFIDDYPTTQTTKKLTPLPLIQWPSLATSNAPAP
jgi:hypothetical protein